MDIQVEQINKKITQKLGMVKSYKKWVQRAYRTSD